MCHNFKISELNPIPNYFDMKIFKLYIILLLLIVNSTGCEKENFTGLDTTFITYIYFPNVMTPDSQENNIFYAQVVNGNPELEYTVELMEIFDRYGNPIFKTEQVPTNDASFGWDGTYQESIVASGTYSYSTRISDGTGAILLVGDLTIIH